MRILNLYAGIGGNRWLWGDEHEVVAVENEPYIAKLYSELFPNDTVICADAHEYLLEHFKEFDMIWSSPPCPTHSRVSTGLAGWGIYRYPDMTLYQEILFLRHFYKGVWVVENVIPYYKTLVEPQANIDRHLFWSNKDIVPYISERSYKGAVTNATKETLAAHHGIELPANTKGQRKLLRNAVNPQLGLHVFKEVTK